jgi:phosphatidylserine/phosphatidylglycerophosphate/cardiolipin synthase-like enzyme
MTDYLRKLSAADLGDLASALRSGRLCPPYSPLSMQRILDGSSAAALAAHLQELADQGFRNDQIATTLELLATDRQVRQRLDEQIDLVTTGPEVRGVTNRDTSVVVREMFATANKSVLVAGYAVYQGQRVFQALAERMAERPTLAVRMILDIQRGPGDTSAASELVRRFAERFRSRQWPLDRPYPAVYFDRRSIVADGPQRACMHAKCVVVDDNAVFISSANFTEAAQQRNIEVGLLIRSDALAERLTRYFDALTVEGLLEPIDLRVNP